MTGDRSGEPGSMPDENLRIAVAGLRAGKPLRAIAVDLYGRERVDAEWHADGWMRANVRRLRCRAKARSGVEQGTK